MQSIGIFHVYYNFYRFLCIIFNHKYTCVSVCGYAPAEVKEPGTGVRGSCEAPNVGAGDRVRYS